MFAPAVVLSIAIKTDGPMLEMCVIYCRTFAIVTDLFRCAVIQSDSTAFGRQ